MKSDDPDDSVPIHPSMAKKASHEVKGTLQEEEKRRPLYLATTASMRAMTLPTKKYVKRESRLPPRMMLKKRTMSSSEASEEEKKKLLVWGSRYRHLRSVVGGTQAEGGREGNACNQLYPSVLIKRRPQHAFQCFHKLTISLFLSLDTMTAIVLTASASTLSAYLIEESNVYLSRLSPHLQFFPSSSSGNWKSICEGGGFFLREDPFFSGEEGVLGLFQDIYPCLRSGSQVSLNL